MCKNSSSPLRRRVNNEPIVGRIVLSHYALRRERTELRGFVFENERAPVDLRAIPFRLRNRPPESNKSAPSHAFALVAQQLPVSSQESGTSTTRPPAASWAGVLQIFAARL